MNEELLNKLIEYVDARIKEAKPREYDGDWDEYYNDSSCSILIELKKLVAQKGGSDE
jgi:hypothetical protein